MKKLHLRLLSILLAAALLLGCGPTRASALSFLEWLFSDDEETEQAAAPSASSSDITHFSEMVYTRPGLDEMHSLLDMVCERAKGKNAASILDGVYDFYDAYDWFDTNATLASIHYNADLTDSYWEEEDNFCTAAFNEVDQMLTTLNNALAASPCRSKLEKIFFGAGFFDDYDMDEDWEPDAQLLELLNRESELISQYYTQVSKSNSLLGSLFPPYKAMAQTMVDLILVRNELASYLGFDSYEDYANAYYYARDYTPEQMSQYLDEIQQTLAPLYIDAYYGVDDRQCSEEDTFEYVRALANAIGGIVLDAFNLMDEAGLYDITQSDNKFNSSFEAYLTSYDVPFIFMNPGGDAFDQLTFAHEFGHFCNDYALGYENTDIDVAEVFSQAMEYLSLIYITDYDDLPRLKMVDSLCTYVEQACYAKFEQEMYRIPAQDLSVEALCQLYERIATDYGLSTNEYFESIDFVTVPHFYTSPMYVFSYIVSNDAAMQIYQLELEKDGAGLRCYLDNLDNSEGYFLAFLESAGLESPFTDGYMDSVRSTFCEILEMPDMAA